MDSRQDKDQFFGLLMLLAVFLLGIVFFAIPPQKNPYSQSPLVFEIQMTRLRQLCHAVYLQADATAVCNDVVQKAVRRWDDIRICSVGAGTDTRKYEACIGMLGVLPTGEITPSD